MILRRYGSRVESVQPNFESKALTEVAFQRDRALTLSREEFEEGWRKVGESREITATAEGDVQDEAEGLLLEVLLERLREVEEEAGEERVVLVENDRTDHPKCRDRRENRIVGGVNRLYFHCRVEPPLRVSVWERAGG